MPLKPSLILITAIGGSNFAHAAPIRRITPKGTTSFTSKAGGFAVWLPFCPHAESKIDVNETGEKLSSHIVMDADYPVSIVYYVFALHLPPRLHKTTIKSRLERMQRGLSRKHNTILQRVETIQMGGFSGLDSQSLETTKLHGISIKRERYYFTPTMFYALTAETPKAKFEKHAAQITKVFDSFRILPQ